MYSQLIFIIIVEFIELTIKVCYFNLFYFLVQVLFLLKSKTFMYPNCATSMAVLWQVNFTVLIVNYIINYKKNIEVFFT